MIKRETYMRRIRPFIGGDLIKVMTGIRRSGKSVMLELIRQELLESGVTPSQFISINFEDLRYTRLHTAEALHQEILERAAKIDGKVYLFFDEIQEVADWEKCVNSLRVAIDCDIYITGSNAKLLSGELATYIGGRYVEFVIYPFSYAEFSELYRTVFPNASDAACFSQYLLSGGMPYLSNLRYEEEPCRQYLTDLFNSVQLKDIVQRGKVRDVDLLQRILAYVMANVGTTFSATSLSRFLKSERRNVSPETVLNYLRYGCDAYLFSSNQAPGPAGQADPLDQREVLHRRPRHPGGGFRRQHAGHQPGFREYCLSGDAAAGLHRHRREIRRPGGGFCRRKKRGEGLCTGGLPPGV